MESSMQDQRSATPKELSASLAVIALIARRRHSRESLDLAAKAKVAQRARLLLCRAEGSPELRPVVLEE
jgi:hypothetical protein